MSPSGWGWAVGWGSLAAWPWLSPLPLSGWETLCEVLVGALSESPRMMLYQVLVPKLITAGPTSQPATNRATKAAAPPMMRAARCRPV